MTPSRSRSRNCLSQQQSHSLTPVCCCAAACYAGAREAVSLPHPMMDTLNYSVWRSEALLASVPPWRPPSARSSLASAMPLCEWAIHDIHLALDHGSHPIPQEPRNAPGHALLLELSLLFAADFCCWRAACCIGQTSCNSWGFSQGWVVTVLNVASLCCPWAEAGWGSFLSTVQATARIENDD